MQKRYKHDEKNTWIHHSILHVHRLLVNKRMIVIRNNKDYMTIHQTKAKPLKLSNKKPKHTKKFSYASKSLEFLDSMTIDNTRKI